MKRLSLTVAYVTSEKFITFRLILSDDEKATKDIVLVFYRLTEGRVCEDEISMKRNQFLSVV